LPLKFLEISLVAENVFFELCRPELYVGFWNRTLTAIVVLVPKATIDENHRPPFWECQIRPSGKVAPE
jgi:hypothetical protein